MSKKKVHPSEEVVTTENDAEAVERTGEGDAEAVERTRNVFLDTDGVVKPCHSAPAGFKTVGELRALAAASGGKFRNKAFGLSGAKLVVKFDNDGNAKVLACYYKGLGREEAQTEEITA